MKRTIYTYLRLVVAAMAFFIVWKPIFMLFNGAFKRDCTFGDFFAVIYHGLSLDLATTGYLLALPLLALIVNIWVEIPKLRRAFLIYFGVAAVLLGLIFVGDTCLYSFWDFKLDATIFNYLASPLSVVQSVGILYFLVGMLAVSAAAALFFIFIRIALPKDFHFNCSRKILATVVMIFIGGLSFLCIRGGIGRSTANIGMVYYSNNSFLNHSAVNPAFSLVYSLHKERDLSKISNFFKPQKCNELYNQLGYNTESIDTDSLLNTKKPNVLLIIVEGFGGTFIGPLGGPQNITPQFNRLTKEGVFFTNCYANSYRTDRGVLTTLSGYPSFPTLSVMKLPAESRHLPSIASTLKNQGYATDFLYGGDINFTNMQSYLRSTGFANVIGDTHFSAAQRITHAWGVTDRIMFQYLFDQLKQRTDKSKPWFTTFLTLASHEPWGVPYNRIKTDKKANAMAYVDDCIGKFIANLKKTPQWRNTLVIILPDHGIGFPEGITEASIRRYHIPLLWLGGAVRKPAEVTKFCNQSDLAATLLGQLSLEHKKFHFSRDVLSKTYTYPTAFHTFDNGFAFIDSTGATVMDLTSKTIMTDSPMPSKRRMELGKAYLQTCYKDLAGLSKK